MSETEEKISTEENVPTLEENFAALEDVLRTLEGEDVSLEEAFGAYSRGVALVKECNDRIDLVEKKVRVLMADGSLGDMD